MVAMVKAGVELAFETMVESGIKEESAYYESLHETAADRQPDQPQEAL